MKAGNEYERAEIDELETNAERDDKTSASIPKR